MAAAATDTYTPEERERFGRIYEVKVRTLAEKGYIPTTEEAEEALDDGDRLHKA
jgi:hypothetical protein